ncbi:glycosyl hydrolase 115 family protein [Pontibacter harenae]|uniref:glycosyl hydrolase 115 family protein n=1 Tax=Pontibacter harenae TaxID=2894083 RepID=UPI001E44CD36|nr:glycosyl hydrolase 115 family protein [Pontibacter harenae]MCC9167364.1 glycosyl hydrolase 115 family protein [Pontibacter harenae]
MKQAIVPYTLPRLYALLLAVAVVMLAGAKPASASTGDAPYISSQKGNGNFGLSVAGKSAPLYVSAEDYPGVMRVAKHLQADIERVTKATPELLTSAPKGKEVVLIGTLGKSPLIDQLVRDKKLDAAGIAGRWETSLIQVVENPMPGIDRALVIAGSDKRGTIYGMYDVSSQIGVSPWYWWADVPVRQQQQLYVLPGRHTQGEPAVKYRGIFINDEAPALAGWAGEKFGGFNHQFYDKVFELILRMKGNYLWPAMWGRAFYVDDPINPKLADEYGVVIGTSHHEPLMRAHAEWERFGEGAWNYDTNKENLQQFWRKGIERMGTNESIVTIGMRGDGDEPMSEESNIALLEKIVDDQRKIIADVTGKAPSETPQMWALYKEVQEYYDKGMRVPDDVTLLLCDDNWGNIRKLPKPGEKQHAGGYGIYYHYDYVGGPRNYKWINTNPIPRIWEQMHLAYEHGADRVWIVNVGDIKPMEFPTEFFLDYAWAPDKWPAERLEEYTRLWVAQQFGNQYAAPIADMLAKYAKYNSRRKPELLAPDTYSLTNYREADRIVAEYNQLANNAEQLYNTLPTEYKDAYYQLILHPIKASANLNELHITVGKNRWYTKQGRAEANEMAAKVKELFEKDAELTRYYNQEMAGGKWNHMMDQTHISYTYWQQPEKDVMPEVSQVNLPAGADMGVAIDGCANWWPMEKSEAVLPTLTPFGQEAFYIDVFNRGQAAFDYKVETIAKWLKVTPQQGKVDKGQRLWVSVNWKKAPRGQQRAPITITGPNGSKVVVQASINNPSGTKVGKVKGFVESNGYVAMDAAHYSNAVETGNIEWQLLPDLGRTGSAMTPMPVTAESQKPGGNSPHLEYRMNLLSSGEVTVQVHLSPTLNFHSTQGLRYAVSIDDAPPQIVNMHVNEDQKQWEQWVANNINITVSKHQVEKPGEHVLKFWMVDPGVVLQKVVVDTGGLEPSYLGPQESYYKPEKESKKTAVKQ